MELINWQDDPCTARGIPPAVAVTWVTAMITPMSGTTAMPGDSMSEQPIVTGIPGIFYLPNLH
jgi:hypothetical protein